MTGQVAAGASAGGDVGHAVAMLSLDKVTSIEAVEAFAASLGGDPCTVEVKLDGLALRVEYRDGKLTLAALRGDGTSGENVTAQVLRGVAGLPAKRSPRSSGSASCAARCSRSTGRSCPPTWMPPDSASAHPVLRLTNRIAYAASRDCLDVDGLGEEIIVAMVEAGLVRDLADLFGLTVEQIAAFRSSDGNRQVGTSIAARITAGLDKARRQPLNRVITALGIRMTGRTVGRWLAARFKTMDALRAATVEEIADIERMGLIKAQHVVAGLAALGDVIDRLAGHGLTMNVPDDGGAKPLQGHVYVVSGSVPGYSRTSVNERIEALGGTASSSVSAKTTALVTAETPPPRRRRSLNSASR